jgi:multidrug resistance efflux pump
MANVTDVTTAPAISTETDHPTALPAKSSRKRNWKKWRARFVVVLMIAGAVVAGTRLAQARGGTLTQLNLGTVTLTGHAIPVASSKTGQVSAVKVIAQQHVAAGQKLGTIITTTTTATGKERLTPLALTAPADGIIVGDPAPVGSVVSAGQPFVQMYDPALLTLSTTMPVAQLAKLSVGMVATLRADGLDRPVEAVVQRAVPRVESQATGTGQLPSGQSRLQLVLAPKRMAEVERLVPGLRFTGTVDTDSVAASTPNILHVNN